MKKLAATWIHSDGNGSNAILYSIWLAPILSGSNVISQFYENEKILNGSERKSKNIFIKYM